MVITSHFHWKTFGSIFEIISEKIGIQTLQHLESPMFVANHQSVISAIYSLIAGF